jgi:hypothetical protein
MITRAAGETSPPADRAPVAQPPVVLPPVEPLAGVQQPDAPHLRAATMHGRLAMRDRCATPDRLRATTPSVRPARAASPRATRSPASDHAA